MSSSATFPALDPAFGAGNVTERQRDQVLERDRAAIIFQLLELSALL